LWVFDLRSGELLFKELVAHGRKQWRERRDALFRRREQLELEPRSVCRSRQLRRKKVGRIGRSWGCPVVRPSIARKLIDTIRNGGVVFAYYPHSIWLGNSRFLNSCSSTLVVANN
jgi:L,D-transpeptidase catalytic domain